jgi:hypothetical protein
MPTKTRPTVEGAKQAARDVKSPPSTQQPGTPVAPPVSRPLQAKSVEKAKSVFKNFSLSKFPKGSMPSNYVPTGKKRADVHNVQRKIIVQHMHQLSKKETTNRGMTLALPETTIKDLLPSFNAKTATIDLNDVMKLIAQNTRGTEFYADGNPTFNRLVLQSRVRKIIATVSQGIKK